MGERKGGEEREKGREREAVKHIHQEHNKNSGGREGGSDG